MIMYSFLSCCYQRSDPANAKEEGRLDGDISEVKGKTPSELGGCKRDATKQRTLTVPENKLAELMGISEKLAEALRALN